MKRIFRSGLLAATAIASLVIAQPAMAYTETGHTGTTGAHSLTDTQGHPYRAVVKLYWYGSDGTSIIGTATDRVAWYNLYEELDTFTRHNNCQDYESA